MENQSSLNKKEKHKINLILVSLVLILVGILELFFLGLSDGLEFWKTPPLGTTLYFLLKEVGKVLFVTGAVTIFLNSLFKKISEHESKERENKLKEQLDGLQNGVKNITGELADKVRSLDTMITDGVVAIYKSRKDAKEAISEELINEKNKTIRLLGISLRDFLKGDNLFYEEWKWVNERLKRDGNALKVQLLLIDPCCEQAIYRAESEEPRKTTHRERNLYREITYLSELLSELLNELLNELPTTLTDNKPSLEVKLYNSSPSCNLMISDNFAFVEQYHYREEITSGSMPVMQYNINSQVGKEMASHFNFVWKRARNITSYIKEKSIGAAEAINDSKILNIYLERNLLTERLEHIIEKVPGTIIIMGISLSSYIKAGSILMKSLGMGEMEEEAKLKRKVRILLINPLSQQAKYRAARESNHPYQEYTFDVHADHRLYNDTMGSIREINRLTKLKSPIEGGVYSSAPSCFIFLNEDSVFIEQYHYGQKEEAKKIKETILSRVVPVIEYSKESTVYSLMKDHLDYVWKECSLSLEEFDKGKDSLEANFNDL